MIQTGCVKSNCHTCMYYPGNTYKCDKRTRSQRAPQGAITAQKYLPQLSDTLPQLSAIRKYNAQVCTLSFFLKAPDADTFAF